MNKKKMTTYKYTIVAVLSCLLFASCIKDKGNYTYNDFPEVAITNIDSLYSARIGDLLTIVPKLTISNEAIDTLQYTYQWLGFSEISSDKGDTITIARTKDLTYLVTLPEAKYKFRYRVFNKQTQLMYSQGFELTVSSDLKQGIVLMSEENGGARLDMISFYNKEFAYKKDILTLSNSTVPVKGKPIQVCAYNDNFSPPYGTSGAKKGYAFYIITDENANRVLSTDLSYKNEYALKYQFYGIPSGFVPEKILSYSNTAHQYLYAQHNLYYSINSNYMQWVASEPLNREGSSSKTFRASPYVAMTASISTATKVPVAVIYNEDSNSFMQHLTGTRTVQAFTNTPSLFPYSNTGKGLVYMVGVKFGGKYLFYAVLDDALTKKRYLAAAEFTGEQTAYQELVAPQFYEAKMIAIPQVGGYMYYVAPNNKEVYCYTLATKTSKVVYTAANGYEINHFRFLEKDATGFSGIIDVNKLFICSFDPTKPSDKNGRLDIMKIETAGSLGHVVVNEKKLEWSDIPKIVSFEYKAK